MFESIIDSVTGLTLETALYCSLTSIALGFVIALVYAVKSSYTKNYLMTLALLPIIVQIIIMMVNGNIGTGVAVLGAFSLVRFRSVQGNSKEISTIFFAMAIGLATGMGHLLFALLFTAIVSVVYVGIKFLPLGEGRFSREKTLRVTVPESVDYVKELEPVLIEFTERRILEKIKTTDLGSLFELTYKVILKRAGSEKQFIDELRAKNSQSAYRFEHI